MIVASMKIGYLLLILSDKEFWEFQLRYVPAVAVRHREQVLVILV
jgi:hypothetical protein